MKTLIFIILLVLLFSGCVGENAQKSLNHTSGSQESVENEATQEELSVSVETLVDLAKKDLAEKSRTPIADIQVAGVTPVEWMDTSLGYPEQGKIYAPVTIQGYVIMLMAEGKLYEYHSDDKRIVPPNGYLKEPLEEIQPVNITQESSGVVYLAKKDLAKRLNIRETNIEVSRIIPTEWPDSSLGYAEPGMMYAQVITPGFVIMLSVDDDLYEYHSDYERVVFPTTSKQK